METSTIDRLHSLNVELRREVSEMRGRLGSLELINEGLEGRLRNGHKYRDAREIYRLKNATLPRFMKRAANLIRKMDAIMVLPARRVCLPPTTERQRRSQETQTLSTPLVEVFQPGCDGYRALESEKPNEL